MDTQQRSAVVELPPMGTTTPEQAMVKSLTHWVWPPYRDINNMGPIEIRSLLGYRGQAWTTLKRCTPYPLGNMTQLDVDRSVAETHSGYGLNSSSLPKIEYVKYAQDQAKELADSYADDQGLRILIPLIGMDDRDLVNRIIQTVQPFEYAIHEMEFEFTTGAENRIEKSDLSEDERKTAREVAKIMRNGAERAKAKAKREHEALISSMSDKMAGGPGIANPTDFHEWICQQLNEPVPRRIDRTGGQGNNNEAINILAKRALREETAAESMTAQLEEERQARARDREEFEARFAALEGKKKTA